MKKLLIALSTGLFAILLTPNMLVSADMIQSNQPTNSVIVRHYSGNFRPQLSHYLLESSGPENLFYVW
ncbi:hypothetical protein ADT67_03110 [Levilactobacillus brevis]|uniref:Uncharacterized protein n=1 Tax=Levilactobacillus brevis TaxID=1580 RepID=A0A5B7Y281_LEVBR|nr:hypothetical protein [Levilactobacillus brevis]MBT9678120.1 hypothetical protein [Levilactobacillus brevis]OLF68187.1 hypothetical protein ADT67_03110 [Levilactobacillus brevis]QCZ48383.1 Hypothetical protein UCCLB95_1132 [Levilactobacillus brevis]QCZ53209.1 hypothetical protein UCCLBBS449_1254 [Levilactobacillus brevis]RDF83080.1 hypothetical protein DQM16_10445 [Levilactobacillus brevis]